MKTFLKYKYKDNIFFVDRLNINKEIGEWLDTNNIPQTEFNKVEFVTQVLEREKLKYIFVMMIMQR